MVLRFPSSDPSTGDQFDGPSVWVGLLGMYYRAKDIQPSYSQNNQVLVLAPATMLKSTVLQLLSPLYMVSTHRSRSQ